MKLLELLKSRAGAISKAGAIGLGVTVGLVGLNVANFFNTLPSPQSQEVRSLAQIMASGGELPQEYSGINVSLGNAQLATAEERAAREGRIFDGGDAGVANLARLDGMDITGQRFSGGEAGLGMGGNEATALPGGVAGQAQVKGNVAGAMASAAEQARRQGGKTKINKLGDESNSNFQRASIARASGSELGSGATGGFGAPSYGGSRSGEIPDALSGAMPSGSTLVMPSADLQGARTPSYVAGNRNARVFGASGSRSQEGESLLDTAKRSAEVARNNNKADNEGATYAFMKGFKGGLVVGDEAEEGGALATGAAGSMDLGADSIPGMSQLKGLENKLDDRFQKEMEEQQKKEAARNLINKMGIAMIFATLAAFITICVLNKTGYGTIAAWIISGVMWAAIAVFAGFVISYGQKKLIPRDMFATWGILAGTMAGVIGLAWIPGVANRIGGIVDKFAGVFKSSGAAAARSAMGYAGGKVIEAGKEAMHSSEALKND